MFLLNSDRLDLLTESSAFSGQERLPIDFGTFALAEALFYKFCSTKHLFLSTSLRLLKQECLQKQKWNVHMRLLIFFYKIVF